MIDLDLPAAAQPIRPRPPRLAKAVAVVLLAALAGLPQGAPSPLTVGSVLPDMFTCHLLVDQPGTGDFWAPPVEGQRKRAVVIDVNTGTALFCE